MVCNRTNLWCMYVEVPSLAISGFVGPGYFRPFLSWVIRAFVLEVLRKEENLFLFIATLIYYDIYTCFTSAFLYLPL